MNPMNPENLPIDVIGLMSGTSLDGLDLCCVHFDFDGTWHYRIVKAESVDYPDELRRALGSAQDMTALEYARLHSDYGLYLGRQVRAFVERNRLKVDLVASIFGGQGALLSRIIYTLVGAAGLWSISLLFRDRDPVKD